MKRGENLKGKRAENAGIKKGQHRKATIEKQDAQRYYQEKIKANIDKLFQTQSQLAFGSSMIFMKEAYTTSDDKVKYRQVLIDDPQLIQDILENPNMTQGDNYTVVTTIAPDGKMITDMLDRAIGKPKNEVELATKDNKPLSINILTNYKINAERNSD